jgi:hypothetical protein
MVDCRGALIGQGIDKVRWKNRYYYYRLWLRGWVAPHLRTMNPSYNPNPTSA